MKFNKDTLVRTGKTFIQAFFGVLIPEIVVVLNNVVSFENIGKAWAYLFPFICSALAAGICAVWNGYMQKGK